MTSEFNARLPRSPGARQMTVLVDGQPTLAFEGEMVAAVLLASGHVAFRRTETEQRLRGLFCGMGICFDCLVTVDGVANVRACVTPVREGMVIQTEGQPRDPI